MTARGRKLRMGMIGGGTGAFIGAVHRMAAAIDGEIELVCGAFSSTPEKSRQSGSELYLDPSRCYANYEEMILAEAALPADKKMDFVSVVTPNHMHYAPASFALEHGFHVICDKPLCHDLADAERLVQQVRSSGLLFALTHNYTGYPMVKQAREMVRNDEFGKIRRVVVEYPQGWLSTRLEAEENKQAGWRTDPSRSGKAGAMGDIGTHAENLAEYITGLKIRELAADLYTHVQGRELDDDGSVMLRFTNKARGLLYASQISAGEENNLRIRIYGEYGGMEWAQQEPNTLVVKWLDRPIQIFRTGSPGLYPVAATNTRVPAGHPEGYIEAFANIYSNFTRAIRSRLDGNAIPEEELDFPTVEDGYRGMLFIEKVIESHQANSKWVAMK